MKGKVVGCYLASFQDGTVYGRLCVQSDDPVDNLSGICVNTVNVNLDQLPVKNLAELVGKSVIVADKGYPKYTWSNGIYLI